MPAATMQLSDQITTTLARLRAAREAGDPTDLALTERRLDWLLSRVPRKYPPAD
ncbi:MAG: hypothetical protein HYZ38_20845 [Mycobacterium sp.]|nr:hypothetical protein [Mycobacterium sp.]